MREPIAVRQPLSSPGQTVETVYFPENGVTSCVVSHNGSQTEVGLIGTEGVTSIGALLGDDTSMLETYVQVGDATALAIPLTTLRDVMEQSAQLRALLALYASYFLLQSNYTTVAFSKHLLETRLARWLLMCHDRVPGDELQVTHEFLGMMIGAQRSGVTITLHSLEGAAMIRSTRGLVTILDRPKLLDLAGDSYGFPEARYNATIAPFGK